MIEIGIDITYNERMVDEEGKLLLVGVREVVDSTLSSIGIGYNVAVFYHDTFNG